MTEPGAVTEITHTARKYLDLLGSTAGAVVGALRAEDDSGDENDAT